ncbi:MAG TPA: hypothetical protein VI056_05350 [Candidatus Limnocylindria bacterium]
MPNCSVQIYFIDSIVAGLNPIAIRVAVLLANCPGGNVVVRTDHTGQSPPTAVGATGATIELPVTVPTSCEDKILVEAWCDQDPACRDTKTLALPCTQCVRAVVSAAQGQCIGNPPLQPVTLSAQIGLVPGQSTQFYFDYDHGGATGAVFTVTNNTTTANTVFNHVEPPYNYPPGNYVPRLRIVPPPNECGPFPLPIKVQCAPTCPSASGASATDKGCVVVTGQGKKRRFELSVTVTTTPSPASATWSLRQKLAGGAFGPVVPGPSFGCPGGQVVGPAAQIPAGPQVVDLDPGDYEATLSFLYPFQNCPGVALSFTAAACPPDCPTFVVATPTVTGCAPNNAVATLNATLSWQTGQAAVPVSAYLWSLEWLDQSVSPPVPRKAQNSTLGPTLTPSIKSNDPGWSGNGASGGVVDLSKPGSYTLTVQALISGVSPTISCNATSTTVPPFQVPACTCPKPVVAGTEWTVTNTTAPLGPNKFQTLPCDTAAVQIGLFVDPGSYAPGDLVFDWTFPGGTSVAGGTSSQPFTFTNATPGTTQTHTVTVTVRVPGSSCAPFTRTVDVTVPGCTQPATAPTLTGSCSIKTGASGAGSVSVTFDQDVDKTSAEDASNYTVSIGGGAAMTPGVGSVAYDASTKTATISGLSINPGDTANVTVKGVKGKTGLVMTSTATTSCSTPKTGSGGGGGGSISPCAILLVLAIILLLLGAVVVVIGVCIAVPWVWIVGAIIGAIGLILFILWVIFCAALTPCSLMQTMHCILFWIIAVVAPILVAVAAIFGGLPCGIAAAVAWGGWGTLYAWLGFVMGRVGCPRIC